MQLIVINQYKIPKFLISENLIYSSASKLFLATLLEIPSYSSAFLSNMQRHMDMKTEKTHKSNPTKAGKKKSLFISNNIGVKTEFRADPSLDAAIFKPNAKARFLLANHYDIITLWATPKFSPPSPKITLPTIINQYLPSVSPNMKTSCPMTILILNTMMHFLTPILSIMTPPANGKIIFGNE